MVVDELSALHVLRSLLHTPVLLRWRILTCASTSGALKHYNWSKLHRRSKTKQAFVSQSTAFPVCHDSNQRNVDGQHRTVDKKCLWTKSIYKQERPARKRIYGKHTILNACVSAINVSIAKQPVAGWAPATSKLSLASVVSSGCAANSVALATYCCGVYEFKMPLVWNISVTQ